MTDTSEIVARQHFVTFYSPGTMVTEETTRPIAECDVEVALAIADEIIERHGARPYAFRFTTRGRTADALDSHVISRSPLHYFGGKVETLAEIEARNDPREDILRSNMRCNGWDRMFTTTKGWRWSQPLRDGDIVLESEGVPS